MEVGIFDFFSLRKSSREQEHVLFGRFLRRFLGTSRTRGNCSGDRRSNESCTVRFHTHVLTQTRHSSLNLRRSQLGLDGSVGKLFLPFLAEWNETQWVDRVLGLIVLVLVHGLGEAGRSTHLLVGCSLRFCLACTALCASIRDARRFVEHQEDEGEDDDHEACGWAFGRHCYSIDVWWFSSGYAFPTIMRKKNKANSHLFFFHPSPSPHTHRCSTTFFFSHDDGIFPSPTTLSPPCVSLPCFLLQTFAITWQTHPHPRETRRLPAPRPR